MGAPRGVSEVTKGKIREAARRLFAERGINGVTVREIAAEAGVTHALVHRYFGTKEDMAKEIIGLEIERTNSSVGAGSGEPVGPQELAEILRRVLSHELIDDPTTLRVILRAELDGLRPEAYFDGGMPRPFALLADWLAEQTAGKEAPDPRILTMIVGCATFGLVSVAPWMASVLGLEDKDEVTIRRECIDVLVGMVGKVAE